MIRLLTGDCRDVLATLPADSVQCVVSSPPYYALRDYGTALWDGGDAACDHKQGNMRGDAGRIFPTAGPDRRGSFDGGEKYYRDNCGKCGAVRIDRQIGLEATPDAYLQTMVQVFREVRRVLRPDGTCWVNIGDSYASGEIGRHDGGHIYQDTYERKSFGERQQRTHRSKPKDLLMMPARLALALQADGWWIRSDIIWHKPNPMPESVTDRPTSAHEHVFLLTRSARYYYDADAVREPQSEGTHERFGKNPAPSSRRKVSEAGSGIKNNDSFDAAMKSMILPNGRSMRNVWTLATHPYIHAHFATYPPALAERCIRAGTSERGCCAQCGKPWVRVTERTFVPQPDVSLQRGKRLDTQHDATNQWPGTPRGTTSATTTGWQPGCAHDADIVPCTVLDPFAGAGTTLLVADRLQRDAIGIELNTAYTEMAMDRVRADAPLFADMADAPMPEHPEDRQMADLFASLAAD